MYSYYTVVTLCIYVCLLDYLLGITPSFTNTLTTVTVPQSTNIGTTVYTLSATDDDTGDKSDLTFLFKSRRISI